MEIELLNEVDSYQYELLNHLYETKFNVIKLASTNSASALSPKNKITTTKSFQIVNESKNGLEFKHSKKNIQFIIKYGDLLDEKVNVIVNAANDRLILGGIIILDQFK